MYFIIITTIVLKQYNRVKLNPISMFLLRIASFDSVGLFQSLQVEAGFVACLVAGVLLALAVPVVVLSHACYRMGGRQEDSEEAAGWAGNCKRRTLVFILQLLLILLL